MAARSPEEQALIAIWAEVLNQNPDSIGIHDNFFTLGGHSLLVIQVISRIRAVFQVELPMVALFEHPTVFTLIDCVHQQRQQYTALPARPVFTTKPVDAPPVLSFAQERLWFLDQLEPNSAFYNVPMALRLQGSLNITALEKAFYT